MKQFINSKNLGLVSSALLLGGSAAAQYSPTPVFGGKIGKTLNETQESFPVRNPQAAEGAPNVVWILIDDIGYGATYVSDILPTTVELVGARVPNVINGYPQEPVEGVSLAYAVAPKNRNLPERHNVQYPEKSHCR
jgi:hypothetical protein